MKETLLSGFIAALITMSSLVIVPIAEAAPAFTPGAVGGTCSVEGQSGQSLKTTDLEFEVEDTVTVANYDDIDLPLTQTLKEGKTESWNASGSVSLDLLKFFRVIFSAGYQSTQIQEVGQTLGPYPVEPDYTDVLEYGFLSQFFRGTHLICKGGKWIDTGRSYWGTIPKERHIRVSMRANEVNRFVDGAAPQAKEYVA